MNSLKDVLVALEEREKLAAEQPEARIDPTDEQTKLAMQQAYDYDQVGRHLARQVHQDRVKEAAEHMPLGHGPGHKHDDGLPCAPHCEHHGHGAAHTEKKASLQRAILERMQRDPAYVAELVARHSGR
jgi:hypothetical protein